MGSVAIAAKDLGRFSSEKSAAQFLVQGAEEDHCHESESLPQPENDCHCAKHRVSCCHVSAFSPRHLDSSYICLLGILSYQDVAPYSWVAPDLEGPFQPPRV